jgi:Zn-dependent metalloprotease
MIRCCKIVPDHIILKVAGKRKSFNKLKLLNNISKSAGLREKRKIVYANRKQLNKPISQAAFLRAGASPTAAPRAPSGMERLWFYDCQQAWDMPNKPISKIEEKHSKDKPAPRLLKQTHIDNMDEAYDFFRDVYKRKSFDKKSATVRFFANYGDRYGNAFWDGEQMVFGLGDEYINDLGSIFDVVLHEYTHAVQQYESDLEYHGQSGALCESLSDVFGSIGKQYLADQTVEDASWLLGENMWNTKTLGSKYKALRDMANPGKAFPEDDQPDHMDNYYNGPEDDAGVHINSGIPNKVFHDFAMELGGQSWKIAGKIWYATMGDQRLVKWNSDFNDFAKATITACKRIKPDAEERLRASWNYVGINI